MPDSLYIPPQGVFFRLLNYASQYVLVSRTATDPQVWHHPVADDYADHYFQLVPGTGKHEGLYLIKSKKTEKVLWSHYFPVTLGVLPSVGHMDYNGTSTNEEIWFKLEPGEGKYAGMFRLICPASATVIFSRTSQDPQVSNYKPISNKYDDHYFSFVWENMEVVRVDYDIKQGKIANAAPSHLATQTLTNDTALEQTMTFNLNESKTHTSTFDYTLGFTVKVGTSIKSGIPIIAEGKINIEMSQSQQWKFGKSDSFTKSWTASFPARAGPGDTVRAVSTVTEAALEVPYTITSRSKDTGREVQTKGIWRGISTYDLRHTVSTVKTK